MQEFIRIRENELHHINGIKTAHPLTNREIMDRWLEHLHETGLKAEIHYEGGYAILIREIVPDGDLNWTCIDGTVIKLPANWTDKDAELRKQRIVARFGGAKQ
jgi:hypothetical protein